MPLKAGLELLKTVVRQPYREPASVSSGDQSVVRHVVVVLGAVAHGIERVQEQPLQAKPALCEHACRVLRHLHRRLGRNHKVHLVLRRVIPAVGVVRLQRRGVGVLRDIVARQHQPVGGRVCQFLADSVGIEHALGPDITARLPLRPGRLVFFEGGKDYPLRHRREDIVVIRRLATDPDESGATPRVTLQRTGDSTVANHRSAELQLRFRKAKPGEIMEDQDHHSLA